MRFWVIPRKHEDAPYDSYITEEVFGEEREFQCLTAFDYDPGLQEAYEIIECVPATPAAVAAEEMLAMLKKCKELFEFLGGVPILIEKDLNRILAKVEGRTK